ncbi:MAG: nicotinic acid mononucleotide adenylyltransferase, partial [Novosphingobium sp.]
SAPALIHLRFDPDPRSATAIRRADPDWASRLGGKAARDPLTHHPVDPDTP